MEGGTLVYVPDEEAVWVRAELVADRGGAGVTVRRAGDAAPVELAAAALELPLADRAAPPPEAVDDMDALGQLHEASVLDTVRARFGAGRPCLSEVALPV